jgi:hypothetical protein
MRLAFVLCAVALVPACDATENLGLNADAGANAPSADDGGTPSSDGSSDTSLARDAPDATSSADAPAHRMRAFVTSAQYGGDIKGAGGAATAIDSADALCRAAADGASLRGTFIAWFETLGNLDPYTRITSDGPWYLVDAATLIFGSRAALKAAPMHAIDRDEANQPVGTKVWGGNAGGFGCKDWSSSDQVDFGDYLSTIPPATLVQSSGMDACSTPHGVLCIEP